MPGRMGGNKTTVKNLAVVGVDEEKDMIAISGPIPGSLDSFVVITKTAKGKKSDLEKEKEIAPEKGADAPEEDGDNKQDDSKKEKDQQSVEVSNTEVEK
jgi:hypothetical protein